ncbi:hypothetical protein [Paenibacillus humicola]|uniref:hypothetical protein n=1 Tax=Paenibacillus humicola TaxID=3110540 RepID=UPI00237A4127|nr:hypothetical protein [Paenibacillus humicola]
MRKRRSTVFVRPGRDLTLYVPSDTPPEVIDYMNRLKAEGLFSQGMMELIVKGVMQELQAPRRREEDAGSGLPGMYPSVEAGTGITAAADRYEHPDDPPASQKRPAEDGRPEWGWRTQDALPRTNDERERFVTGLDETGGKAEGLDGETVSRQSAGDAPWMERSAVREPGPAEQAAVIEADSPAKPGAADNADEPKKFSLAQIFRQAKTNAGKLAPAPQRGNGGQSEP